MHRVAAAIPPPPTQPLACVSTLAAPRSCKACLIIILVLILIDLCSDNAQTAAPIAAKLMHAVLAAAFPLCRRYC